MRTLLFSCLLALNTLQTYAQLATNVEGLGPFKIGKTEVSFMDRFANETGRKVKVYDKSSAKMSWDEVYEFRKNKKNPSLSPEHANSCPNVRVFYLPKYTVSDIEIKKVLIEFYEEKLARICVFDYGSATKLREAFNTKYKAVSDTTIRSVSLCKESKSWRTYTLWGVGDIIALTDISKVYDAKCEYTDYWQFVVGSKEMAEKVERCKVKDL